MVREMEVTQRLQEASLTECRVEATTQKLVQLCERVKFACNLVPKTAVAKRTAGALHTLLLPHGETRGHKIMTRQDNVEEMAHAMKAARRCTIVVDDTPALDVNWGKFHNPWENALPHGAKAVRLTRFVDRMYVCARACPFGVYLGFHL